MYKSLSLVLALSAVLCQSQDFASGQTARLRLGDGIRLVSGNQEDGLWANRPVLRRNGSPPTAPPGTSFNNSTGSLGGTATFASNAQQNVVPTPPQSIIPYSGQEVLPSTPAEPYESWNAETEDSASEYASSGYGEYFNQATQSRVRGCVGFDSCLTRELLDFQNRQTDKPLTVLSHNNGNCFPELIVGGQMRASFLASATNTANKFSYLGRFPPDFVGDSVTDARLLHANMSSTAHFSRFAHGQVELLFSDVFSFPAPKQGSFQVRQAYVTIGDLETTPWYAFVGKHNISFGDMRSLSPFSQSVVWHYFGGLAEGAGAGFKSGDWHWTATAINGGRGIRVVDSQAIGQLNNFAANGTWQLPLGNCDSLQLGGGYLHGTIYDSTTAEHTNTAQFGPRNPAWDVNAHLNVGCWQFSGEFASTVNPWPVTSHEVAAWRSEAARDVCVFGLPGRLSASFSEGIQGSRGTEFEFNRQLVLGLGIYPTINTQVTFEYVQSTGFAPLIDITTVSDRDVIQNSFVMGLVFVL